MTVELHWIVAVREHTTACFCECKITAQYLYTARAFLWKYSQFSPSPSISIIIFVMQVQHWEGRLKRKIEVYCTAQAFLWKYSQFSPSPSISIILFVMQVKHWEGRLKRKIEKKDWSILHSTSISLKILTIFTISIHLHHSFCYAGEALRGKIEKEDWEKRLKYIAQHKHFFENTHNFHIHPSPSFFLLCRCNIEKEDWKGRLRKKIEVYCRIEDWRKIKFSHSLLFWWEIWTIEKEDWSILKG